MSIFAFLSRKRKGYMVAVAQSVRASDCGSEGRGFESHRPPKREKRRNGAFLFWTHYFITTSN